MEGGKCGSLGEESRVAGTGIVEEGADDLAKEGSFVRGGRGGSIDRGELGGSGAVVGADINSGGFGGTDAGGAEAFEHVRDVVGHG